MRAAIVVYWAFALLAHGSLGAKPCEQRTQLGDNACSLRGGLMVKSVPNNLEVTSQKCNIFFKKSEFSDQPVVSLADAKPEELYTLVMVDPDAPKHPKGKYYLHWIQSNIRGEDFKRGDFKKSTTLTSYRGPTPPDKTGIHRYLLLAYVQPSDTRVQGVPDNQRSKFDLEHWLGQHKLCGPVSGVQFRTNYSGNEKS